MKTVCVFVTFKDKSPFAEAKKTVASAVFGPEMYYDSAHDFIKSVIDLHKAHSSEWEITNVVIG